MQFPFVNNAADRINLRNNYTTRSSTCDSSRSRDRRMDSNIKCSEDSDAADDLSSSDHMYDPSGFS